jgi:hypothetical protein
VPQADFNSTVFIGRQAPLDLSLASSSSTSFEFTDQKLGGFERKRMGKDLRIRGWRISNHLYVGQAKVAKKWGLGLVYEVNNTVYGLNHRGLQIMKRF